MLALNRAACSVLSVCPTKITVQRSCAVCQCTADEMLAIEAAEHQLRQEEERSFAKHSLPAQPPATTAAAVAARSLREHTLAAAQVGSERDADGDTDLEPEPQKPNAHHNQAKPAKHAISKADVKREVATQLQPLQQQLSTLTELAQGSKRPAKVATVNPRRSKKAKARTPLPVAACSPSF